MSSAPLRSDGFPSMNPRIGGASAKSLFSSSSIRAGAGFAVSSFVRGPANVEIEAESESGDEAEVAPMRVLVVDDCPANARLVEAILKGMGHIPETAIDGQQAVDLVFNSGNRYEIIFMDLQMPELNGFEATLKIREGSLDYRPSIVALTANCFEQDRQSALDCGMDDFLSKPVRVQMIRDTVYKWGANLPSR